MLDKEQFFERYKVEEWYEKSGLSWEVLEEIYDDYRDGKEDFIKHAHDIQEYILENMADNENISIHSIQYRIKNPEHLIEKIIRKRGDEQNQKYQGIDVSNYRAIVRDLIGIRILVLAKEQWEGVFDWIMMKFSGVSKSDCEMAEPPVAYTRYGDRDIFGDKIHREHTNKGYRSQHYVIKYGDYYCEIQVRTLAEEVYGEFDHKVKYPYREKNKFLLRYTSSVSQLLNSVDEIISTCFQLGEEGWKQCDLYCEKDAYIDWKNTSQQVILPPLHEEEPTLGKAKTIGAERVKEVNVAEYANEFILRKD